jgi:hypothetical protein
VPVPARPHIRRRLPALILAVIIAGPAAMAGCTTGAGAQRPTTQPPTSRTVATTTSAPAPVTARAPGPFTIAFAGDVNFAERTADRLRTDPAAVFAQAAAGLRAADLTMVNLETAITTGGQAQNKAFTFRAPPTALTALRDAGIDVATMANNHGADYGADGLRDSLAAVKATGFPVIGIGRNAAAAFAPYRVTLNGTKVAIFAADQVQDETTLRLFSAGPDSAGVANAWDARLVRNVRAAHRAGYVVVVYLHWGTEFHTCPNGDQTALAATLADAGAAAVIGTHAHVLQGAGWRPDGTYVAYGLGNYLWWMSFGNKQDDNGVLTLTFRRDHVTGARFAPSHLDSRGVPQPATGAEQARITSEWKADRQCAGLSATPPA